jgi:hypothetical protein
VSLVMTPYFDSVDPRDRSTTVQKESGSGLLDTPDSRFLILDS